MKKLASYVALTFAVVATVIAAATIADSIKFFQPGVPYSAFVHHALICGAIVSTAALIDLGALLTLIFLRDTDTQHNPQE